MESVGFPMDIRSLRRLPFASLARVLDPQRPGRHKGVIGKNTRVSGYMLETALTRRFLEMAALILSCGAPKGISPAPRLRSALPFQEITLAFVPFETRFSISAYDSCGSVAITRRRASG